MIRDLSHLYHYYLHGAEGNRGSSSSQRPGQASQRPGAGDSAAQEAKPEIVVQCLAGGRLLWRTDLAEVADDPESQYLMARPPPTKPVLAPSLLRLHAAEGSHPPTCC